MNSTDSTFPSPGTYTPGYAKLKVLVIVWGFLLLALGLWQLWTPLRLVFFGERTEAEVTCVIKTKPGLPDLVLKDDLQVQAGQEKKDRSYVFWNEFVFHTRTGREVTVRAPVGSQIKPLYTLLDEDGLPTTDHIYYDPGHPETVVFPGIISTWFVPGMLTFVGALGVLIGSTLLYWANKPIELPHIPPAEPASGGAGTT